MNNRLIRSIIAALLLFSLIGVGQAMAVPAAPTGLTAVSQAGGDIALSWNPVSGATSYLVYASLVSSPIPTAEIKEVSSNSTVVSVSDGIASGCTWYFWVKAKDAVPSVSDPSNMTSAVCDTKPPGGVSLSSPIDGSYVVTRLPMFSWGAVSDDTSQGCNVATGVDYYELQYSTSATFSPGETTTISNIAGTSSSPTYELPNATYYWRVRAFDVAGNVFEWTSPSIPSRSFMINLSAPTLLGPADNSSFNGVPSSELPPTFSWTEVSGANGYLLEIDTEMPLSAPIAYTVPVTGGSTTSKTPSIEFSDGTYYWRVSATDSGGSSIGIYSSVWSFSVDTVAPGAPTLTSPADGITTSDTSPTFLWEAVSTAYKYKIDIADDSGFTNVIYSYPLTGDLTITTHTIGTDLPDGTYYWHVKAIDAADNEGSWSSSRSFVVDTTIPPPPTLSSPANGSTITDATPAFSWTAVSGATSYTIEYSTSAAFTTSVTASATSTSYTVPGTAALSNTTYYWRVSSNLAPTQFSDTWSVTINAEATEPLVSFNVIVRSGATGEPINAALVKITSGPSTIASSGTSESGSAHFSIEAGTYTFTITKNLWDNGSGNTFSESYTVTASTTTVNALLYQTGYDLIVATIKYNDKFSSAPDSVIIYKDGTVHKTVTLPMVPSAILPNNLKLAKTNLVVEVPNTGSYTIADPIDTGNPIQVTNLSQTLFTAYNNSITIQITSSLNGVVVDEGGNIVTGSKVILLRTSDNSIMGAVDTSSIGFIFNLLLPGNYYLRISKDNYDDLTTDSFIVDANETKNLGMLTLTQQKGTLNITIQTSDGQLVTDANVSIADLDGNVVFSQLAAQGIVGTLLPGGTYTIDVSATGYTLDSPVTAVVTADETSSKTITMTKAADPIPETGSLQLSVSDAEGNPLQLVEVYIDGTKVGVTNQDGILLIEDLDAGTYQVTLKKEGYADKSSSYEVVAGDTTTVTPAMDEEVAPDTSSRVKWILIAVVLVLLFAVALYVFMNRKGEEVVIESSSGKHPAAGPRSTPSSIAQRPKVVPKAPEKNGIPTSSAKVSKSDGGEHEKGGIPSHSIKDE